MAFLFTRWSYAKKDVRYRIKDNQTEDEKSKCVNQHLTNKDIYTPESPLRCFFIDNSLNDEDNFLDASEDEQAKYEAVRQDIKTWLKQLPRFYCKDINDIEKVNKNLESQL